MEGSGSRPALEAQTVVDSAALENHDARRFGRAWLALTLTLAAHVVDEAATGFLSFYNPIVLALRARFAWFPMPTFEFGPWLAGLCVAVAVLLALTRRAYAGSRALRLMAYPYAALMVLNGAGHLAGSVYFRSWVPGAVVAPLLLAAAAWLLKEA